jgi:uncharacterized spore protein YtfJ
MSEREPFPGVVAEVLKTPEQAFGLLDKLTAVADPAAVYSDPVEAGEYTIITASEVTVSLGMGFGGGGGRAPSDEDEGHDHPSAPPEGVGIGGGGGGMAAARPVAAIVVGPTGVHVQPIVDVTKIALAWLTAFGALWVALARMRRLARGKQ